jgi:hypothetical protein
VALTPQTLRTEIDADPKGLGLNTLRLQSNGPEAVAAKLNEPGASAETLFKAYVPVEDVTAAIVRAEYDALSATAKAFLADVLLRTARLKTGDANLRASMGGIFAAGTTSRTSLTALASRSASRAEALWGEGTMVLPVHVAEALAL